MADAQHFISKIITAMENTGEEKVMSKGEFLLKEGDIERNLYLIMSGAVRVFYLSEFNFWKVRLGCYVFSILTNLILIFYLLHNINAISLFLFLMYVLRYERLLLFFSSRPFFILHHYFSDI